MNLYKTPPPETHVKMGPVSAKTYSAARWWDKRPHVEADYGRRGKLWVFGAFEPRTGQALTYCALGRAAPHFLALLTRSAAHWQGEMILIMDNLVSHKTLDVRLWAVAHPPVRFLFQPTDAPWLNLSEPWWKTLRSLALKGRRFKDPVEPLTAISNAVAYWNVHRHPYVWRKAVA